MVNWRRSKSRRATGESSEDVSPAALSNVFVPSRPTSSSPLARDDGSQSPGTIDLAKVSDHAPIPRWHSAQSGILDFRRRLFPSSSRSHQQQQGSQDRRDDPLGLTVLHAPDPQRRTVDILFIHGLGGSSLRTWCSKRDLDLLWPKKWLPEDTDLATARILTFGYNAQFSARGERTSLSIGDFANDLLFSMKYGGDGIVKMGQVPIIVVAHSMGGLVFKKAFVRGYLNEEYRKLVSSIKAAVFLATPHRGTDLAETLNLILTSSIFGHSSRVYVSELARNSPTIDDLNESFRHRADKLRIFSFHETLATAVGPVTVMIVDKQSSLLGYKDETLKPLVANHHDVCKFTSRDDPNYKSVLGALRSLVNMLRFSNAYDGGAERDLEVVGNWLNVTRPPEEDMATLRSLHKAGTCEDIVCRPEFERWLQSESPHILWVSAAPGSGKSVHCSYLIDYFKNRRSRCSYWFFRYGDLQKRSISNMFRSIAYQMVVEDATYRRALVGLSKSGIQIDKADAKTVWRNIFGPYLHLFDHDTVWAVDGLDESESSKMFFEVVTNIDSTTSSIRIIVFSRPLPSIIQSAKKAKKRVELTELTLTDNLKDIRLFLNDEMDDFVADEDFKQNTVDEITARSQGNFLWVRLVTERVVQCLRLEDVARVLQENPNMDMLYRRMAEAIAKLALDADKRLSQVLLSWAMYSSRPIAVEELSEPYAAELGTIMDLKHTVSQVCGQFVVIDANNQLSLVHHSAREYLQATPDLPFSLEASDVNEKLFLTCLTSICGSSLRTKLQSGKVSPFLLYASVYWISHLDQCFAKSDTVLQNLSRFFNGDYPLTWIQFLAMNNLLSVLETVSSSLSNFVRRRREVDAIKPPTLHPLSELSVLDTWAVDLLKITAKFGSRLIEDPDAMYRCVPALSPENSILYQKYAQKLTTMISVSGLHTSDWDDCLAKVSSGTDQVLHVAASAQYLAVAVDSTPGRGTIKLWSSDIFKERPGFHTDDPICNIAFSPSGSLLACYGLDRTNVWRLEDMSLVTSLGSPNRERALALQFAPDESFLVIATDLRRVYRLNIDTKPLTWLHYPSPLLEENVVPEGGFINSPSSAAFNKECTQVAVAYTGFPLTIWDLSPPARRASCRQTQREGQTFRTTWTGVNRVVWHPFDGNILGIYRNGNIFKWGTEDNNHEEINQELEATPSEIRCSPNGLVFATSDVQASVRLYDYSQMVLIYKLTSDDIIYSIDFSPDSRRFYDLRGSNCNIWEPSCLLRIADGGLYDNNKSTEIKESDRAATLSSDSDSARAISEVSVSAFEAHAGRKPAINAVALCPRNNLLCAYAEDEATVKIYEMDRNIRHDVAHFDFGMGIRQVALSSTGDYIAYSTYGGKVTVKQLDLPPKRKEVKVSLCWTEKKPTNRGGVGQLLFDTASTRLLVSGGEKVQVLNLVDGSVIAERTVEQTEPSTRWEVSLDNPEILLAFTARAVCVFTWNELRRQCTFPFDLSQGTTDLPPASSIAAEVLLPSYHPRMHLISISLEEANAEYLNFLLLDTSALREHASLLAQGSADNDAIEGTPNDGRVIRPLQIPADTGRYIEQPLGILQDGRLAFLDENLWVCTAQVWSAYAGSAPKNNSPITRHFFIPRDWLNSTGQMLCRVQADGTLLCPAKGEMAIVRSDLGSEW